MLSKQRQNILQTNIEEHTKRSEDFILSLHSVTSLLSGGGGYRRNVDEQFKTAVRNISSLANDYQAFVKRSQILWKLNRRIRELKVCPLPRANSTKKSFLKVNCVLGTSQTWADSLEYLVDERVNSGDTPVSVQLEYDELVFIARVVQLHGAVVAIEVLPERITSTPEKIIAAVRDIVNVLPVISVMGMMMRPTTLVMRPTKERLLMMNGF